jgi:phytanoyl-CoA hydroxylase
MSSTSAASLDQEQLSFYNREGYLIVRGLWTQEEVQALKQVVDTLAEAGTPIPGYWEPLVDPKNPDPLKRYPRMLHIHRYEPIGMKMMLDRRIHDVVAGLINDEPIACQSMLYFKPPGSRGQAFHQDNFYLAVKPGTCLAAWTAIDPATPQNGGLWIVPKTQEMELRCPQEADGSKSFVNNYVPPPPGTQPVAATLDPGDVLFFNGSVIHGSQPNSHPTMWRRSFICHYMPKSAESIWEWYFPLYDFEGRVVGKKPSPNGGPCGENYDWSKNEKFH